MSRAFIGDYSQVAIGSNGVAHAAWTDFRGNPGLTAANQDVMVANFPLGDRTSWGRSACCAPSPQPTPYSSGGQSGAGRRFTTRRPSPVTVTTIAAVQRPSRIEEKTARNVPRGPTTTFLDARAEPETDRRTVAPGR